MMKPEQQFWNHYWRGSPGTLNVRTMTQILDRSKFQYLQEILPPSGRTLEVGAGSGRLSCMLASAGFETICLDFSATAMQAAKTNYRQAQVQGAFVVGEGGGLPFRSDSSDVVLSTGLLEHFQDPSFLVNEMVRVLKPGGLFYSDIVPKKFSLFRSLDWLGKIKRICSPAAQEYEEFFERSFSNNEIVQLLRGHGLKNISVFPAGVVPPYLPLISRSQRLREMEVALVDRMQSFWKGFDGTDVAEWLGFYYFAYGTKPVEPHG